MTGERTALKSVDDGSEAVKEVVSGARVGDLYACAAAARPARDAAYPRLARSAAVLAATIGVAVLAGWAVDSVRLTSVVHGLPAMRPWTATGIVLAGLALWLAASRSPRLRAASAAPAAVVVAVAAVALFEHATGVDFGTDVLLFRDKVLRMQRAYAAPGRMTPIAAQALLAVGSALLLAPRAKSALSRAAFALLGTVAVVTGGVALVGHVLGLESLDSMLFGYVPAVHAAAAVALLGVGTLSLRPDDLWLRSMAELGRTARAPAALLVSAVLLFGYSAQVTLGAAERAQDATAMALKLETLLSTIKDAETGKRGFLLTGDQRYLEPYDAARARLGHDLAALHGDAPGEAVLTRLQALVDAKMAELAETVALRRAGDAAAALAIVETGRGKALMDDLRSEVDALANAARDAAATARAEELRAAVFAALGGIALVVLALWAVTATAHARRDAAERAAADAQALSAKEIEAREHERRAREVQAELAHANRVATMGQLTASIAHEVKQPIAATLTNAQAALRWLKAADVDEVRDALVRIVGDAGRAADVIGRIRGLVEKAPARRDVVDVNAAIHDVIALLRGELLKHDVAVHVTLADRLPLVRADRVQVQQVIVNLVLNAVEAMMADPGGLRALGVATAADGTGGVQITVHDSGPGLRAEDRERVVEAFYTTKADGLGLGLSICDSIIAAHGGRLSVRANEPRGAVFEFTLPADGS